MIYLCINESYTHFNLNPNTQSSRFQKMATLKMLKLRHHKLADEILEVLSLSAQSKQGLA